MQVQNAFVVVAIVFVAFVVAQHLLCGIARYFSIHIYVRAALDVMPSIEAAVFDALRNDLSHMPTRGKAFYSPCCKSHCFVLPFYFLLSTFFIHLLFCCSGDTPHVSVLWKNMARNHLCAAPLRVYPWKLSHKSDTKKKLKLRKTKVGRLNTCFDKLRQSK